MQKAMKTSSFEVDLLVSLPVDLTGILLSSWLDLKSIALVDSAYCSKSKRPLFLRSLGRTEDEQQTNHSLLSKMGFVQKCASKHGLFCRDGLNVQ